MVKLLPTISSILLAVLKQATSQTTTLECPNSIDLGKWTKVELNNGALTFNYAIVLSDSGSNPDERSIMCGRLESDTDGYIAFGISPEGTMEGAQAVIGSPTLMTVEKYTLIGSSPRIRKMSIEKQTLLYTSITTQEEDSGEKTTVMEFAKYLNEEGENDIVVGEENTFIWALGSSDELNYHSARDSFKVNIESPEVSTNTTAPSPAAEEVSDEQTACLTEDECKAKSEEMGMIFESGTFPTKGCYSKNDKIFWSPGTDEEMTSMDLPGTQERVWCTAETVVPANTTAPTNVVVESTSAPSSGSPTSSPSTGTPTSTPTVTGPTECELGPNADPEKGCEPLRTGTFCALEEGVCNNKSGIHIGTCTEIPENCIEIFDPVCGCDNTTYSNACFASAALTGVSRRGECEEVADVVEETLSPSKSPIVASTVAPTMAKEENVACTEDECKAKSEEMGMIFESGTFPTKGCFSKNDKVFWSQGSEEEMISTDLPGTQERVWCTTETVVPANTTAPTNVVVESTTAPSSGSPTSSPSTGTPSSTPSSGSSAFPTPQITTPTPPTSKPVSDAPVASLVEAGTVCLTEDECKLKSEEMGMLFMTGEYSTKGCFTKADSGKVFFSPGTEEEMSTADLPGLQDRVYCDDDEATSAPTNSPTPKATTSSPTTPTGDVVDSILADTDSPVNEIITTVNTAAPTSSARTDEAATTFAPTVSPPAGSAAAARDTSSANTTGTGVKVGIVAAVVGLTTWLL